MNRVFKDAISSDNDIVIIDGDDAFHLSSVLRLKKGDEIVVCDGRLNDYLCEITTILKNEVVSRVISVSKNETENTTKIILFQAMPKADKMELVIQKSVELGVFKIVPVITEFTVSRPRLDNKNKISRYRKICEAAARQAGRGIIPEISDIISFNECVNMMKQLPLSVAAYEKETSNSLKSVLNGFNGDSIGVFIGPEGGISQNEIKTFMDNNIPQITLGRRILRTETAGICAISAINYELGEF